MAQQIVEVVEVPEVELVDLWIVYNKRGSILSVSPTEVPGGARVKVRPEKVAETMAFTPPKAWVIRDTDGGLLFRAFKPIVDPRVTVVDATDAVIDEPVKSDVWWIVKDDKGVIQQVAVTYPLDPAAIPLPKDHAEITAKISADQAVNATLQARNAAWARVRERLIDEELANGGGVVVK